MQQVIDTPPHAATRAVVGSGDYRYEIIDDWAKLPEGWFLSEVGGIGVDSRDNVYLFNRGNHPVIVLDRDGNVLTSWGHGLFRRPHGLHMGPDETLWLTDEQDHTVRQFTLDGKLLMQLGESGKPAPFMSGRPFCRCCHTALAPNGDILVADGYANSRVHRFSRDGKLLQSWGETGSGPGQFNVVHNICCDADGWIYVADRENHRIQVFDGKGRVEAIWQSLHRPCGLYMPPGRRQVMYVGELGPAIRTNRHFPNLGPRLSILGPDGGLITRIGADRPGLGPDQFMGPHGLAVDSQGDLYVGEVPHSQWPFYFDEPTPPHLRCLRKLRKLPPG